MPRSKSRNGKITSQVPINAIFGLEANALDMGPEMLSKVRGRYEEHVENIKNEISTWLSNADVKKQGGKTVTNDIQRVSEEALFHFLSDVFYNKLEFRYVSRTLLITSIMSDKFNCYSSTVILGDALARLGKPMTFIMTPRHILASGAKYAFETTAIDAEFSYFSREELDERYPIRQEGEVEILLSAANNWCGSIFSRTGRLFQAHNAYKAALELVPRSSNTWNKLGNVLNNLKRPNDALKAFEKAIELEPDLAVAWCGKGNALTKLKRVDDAIAAYETAIHFDDKSPVSWHNVGLLLRSKQQYQGALEAFKTAINLSPGGASASLWFDKGITLDRMGKFDDANLAYERAVTLAPNDSKWMIERVQELRQELRRRDALLRTD